MRGRYPFVGLPPYDPDLGTLNRLSSKRAVATKAVPVASGSVVVGHPEVELPPALDQVRKALRSSCGLAFSGDRFSKSTAAFQQNERSFWLRVARIGRCRSEGFVLQEFKRLFTNCRNWALGSQSAALEKGLVFRVNEYLVDRFNLSRYSVRSRTRILFQISRAGRALPLPSKGMVEKALETHVEVLRTEFVTPKRLVKSFHRFVKEWASQFRPTPGAFKLSLSASVDNPSSNGGIAKEVADAATLYRFGMISRNELREEVSRLPRDLFGEYVVFTEEHLAGCPIPSSPPCDLVMRDLALFPYSTDYELSLEQWELVREHLFAVASSWLRIRWSDLPTARQVALPERGYKVRVVTPIEGCLAYLGSTVNSTLLSAVWQDEHLASAKFHGHDTLSWSGRCGNQVWSADLTAASDYLPMDLMSSGFDALCSGWNAPWWFEALLHRLGGRYRLRCADGTETLTQRGLLMGSPVAWPMLSLYMRWIHHASGSDGMFNVCGDDYVACHTVATYYRGQRTLRRTGGVVSPGKDFFSFVGKGVFAERFLDVPRKEEIPSSSVRLFCGMSKDPSMPSWAYGPSLATACEGLKESLQRSARGVIRRNFSEAIAALQRERVHPFFPRWLGGAGFPRAPGPSGSWNARIARCLLSQTEEIRRATFIRFSSAWSATEGVLREAHAYAEELFLPLLAEVATGDEGAKVPVSQISGELISTVATSFLLARGPMGTERRLNLGVVGRRVRSSIAQVKTRAFWTDPLTKVPASVISRLIGSEPTVPTSRFLGIRGPISPTRF